MSFSAFFRGMKQRLPNGNTLILDPDNRRLFEVTRAKNSSGSTSVLYPLLRQASIPRGHAVNGARRYGADELTFLKGRRVPGRRMPLFV